LCLRFGADLGNSNQHLLFRPTSLFTQAYKNSSTAPIAWFLDQQPDFDHYKTVLGYWQGSHSMPATFCIERYYY
jgi:hypothetical protein